MLQVYNEHQVTKLIEMKLSGFAEIYHLFKQPKMMALDSLERLYLATLNLHKQLCQTQH